MTLLIDPMVELALQLGQVEDWLGWAECDTDEQAAMIEVGTTAAGELASAVRTVFADTPQLYDPAGVELGLIAAIPSEAVSEAHGAILAAAGAVEYGENRRPTEALRSLGIIANCLAEDGTDAVLQLAAVLSQANVGGSRWQVATVRGEDDRAAAVDRERTVTRLDAEEYQAYRRYLAAVFSDPLTRFAATGP